MSARLRPDILAHPSPTTGRFLLLVGVMLSAGMEAANLLFVGLFPSAYQEAALSGNPIIAVVRVFGAMVVAVLSIAIVLAVPTVLRERRKLREPGAGLDPARARIAELAAQAGVRPPRLLVGSAGQRDAFVFGVPGRYWLVMPTALGVRWRNRALFDPVVNHELAHLRRHDVPLAWLASAAWLAALPLLALPFGWALVRFELTVAWSVLWQSILVLGVVWLLRREALRSREHDADLDAARRMGDFRPLWTTLRIATGRPLGSLRRLVSHHPTPARRMDVLADPAGMRSVSLVDGLSAALLSMLIVAPLANLTSNFVAGLMVGPVLGLAVGVGLWRQALIDHVNGQTHWPGGVAAGVVAGLLLGHLVDFAGLGVRSGWNEAIIAATMMVMGAGAVALSAGTGRLWADAAARLPGGRASWAVGVLANSIFFGLALWAIRWFPAYFGTAEESALPLDVLVIGGSTLIGPAALLALVPAAVTVFTLLARRRPLPVPQWLIDGPPAVGPSHAVPVASGPVGPGLSHAVPLAGGALVGGAGSARRPGSGGCAALGVGRRADCQLCGAGASTCGGQPGRR